MPEKLATLRLYQSHRPALVDYARAIIGDESHAEDVVQDAWLRFDGAVQKAQLREPLRFLYRIVRNLAIDSRRRIRTNTDRYSTDVLEVTNVVASDSPSPEEAAVARNELDHILAALRELPERTRIAVEMHRFGGHTLAEIAETLDISVGTAHALVADGVKHCHRRRITG